MQLIYVSCEIDDLAAVIVNGVMVYHEDNDKGYNNPNFGASLLADRLAKALGSPVIASVLDRTELNEQEWNFDDVLKLALEKAA